MPVISFTAGDILRSKLIDEGFYPAKITQVTGPATSKDGKSVNFVVQYTLGEKSPAPGKVIEEYFNSKAIGRMIPLIAACRGVAVSSIIDSGQEFQLDTDEIINHEIDLKVIRELYEGQWANKAGGYLPTGMGSAAPPF